MADLNPTLGDLRRAIRDDPPPADCELSFDLAEREPMLSSGPEPGESLPDAIHVDRDLIERVAGGGYADLPDSTPLSEVL